jgi:hypothetical protein
MPVVFPKREKPRTARSKDVMTYSATAFIFDPGR